jgi:hypothetical protein
MVRRIAAILALPLALVIVGCSLLDDPSPSPTPSSPSPSGRSSPRSTSARDREHADLLEVQNVYRTVFKEELRLQASGGITKPTPILLQTTSGTYRRGLMQALKSVKADGIRMTTPGRLVGVSMGAWNPARVSFYGCEDYGVSKWVKSDGSAYRTDPSSLRYEQHLVAKKSDGRWRIDDVRTKWVKSFAASRCNGTWYR